MTVRQPQGRSHQSRHPQCRGARLLFLSPYNPDLNPIEQVFSKLKHFMRIAQGRSVEAVSQAIASILPTFTKQECANYLVNAGYASA